MSIVLLPLIFAVATANYSYYDDPAANQLAIFKEKTKKSIGTLTTCSGSPVEYRDTQTLNKPIIHNEHLMDLLQDLSRERIPERVVHAPGTGAFGYFETTHDITRYCKADLFSKIGKKTPVGIRFSISGPRSGSPDTVRGSRGYACKFYTKEGNLDLTGFNIPIFAFRNPLIVVALSRILKSNPVTNLPDPNMLWDFVTQNPETIHANLYQFSDLGVPASYSDMTGHAVHTFQVYNKHGVSSYMRFHFIPVGGPKYLNATEVKALASGDPNFFAKGLYNKIAKANAKNGDYPKWYLKAQILTEEDYKNATLDIWDVTQILPLDQYPLHPIGTLTLNRNPSNYFAEIEQMALCPGNVVPGILGSPDKIFESRRFAYRDAAIHRLGVNFKKLPVNCPVSGTHTYMRDGAPPLNDNEKGAPNYWPNMFNGPVPYRDDKRPDLVQIYEEQPEIPDNFGQVAKFYSKELTEVQRQNLVEVILESLCLTVDDIKKKAVKWFKLINSDLANRVSKGLTKCQKKC